LVLVTLGFDLGTYFNCMGYAMKALRKANAARQKEWPGSAYVTLAFFGCELAGETGEACNIIKKLERMRLGIAGSTANLMQLADELADVVIVADLIALYEGIDLQTAVHNKFNKTSEKLGLATRMATEADPCANGICLRTGERIDDWSDPVVGAKGRCGDCPGLK
jgi:NTP pyrophosphatase (non-canonical NTP hydrolase)